MISAIPAPPAWPTTRQYPSDVQAVLRHAHLSTTSGYVLVQTQDMLDRVRQHNQRTVTDTAAVPGQLWGYDSSGLAELNVASRACNIGNSGQACSHDGPTLVI